MTILYISPGTPGASSATTYYVIWPHDGRYSILWSMWCSSLRWALQDAAQDFTQFLKEMFPDGYEVHLLAFNYDSEVAKTVRTTNLGIPYDLDRLSKIRSKYGLPPWKPEDDCFRYIDYKTC